MNGWEVNSSNDATQCEMDAVHLLSADDSRMSSFTNTRARRQILHSQWSMVSPLYKARLPSPFIPKAVNAKQHSISTAKYCYKLMINPSFVRCVSHALASKSSNLPNGTTKPILYIPLNYCLILFTAIISIIWCLLASVRERASKTPCHCSSCIFRKSKIKKKYIQNRTAQHKDKSGKVACKNAWMRNQPLRKRTTIDNRHTNNSIEIETIVCSPHALAGP